MRDAIGGVLNIQLIIVFLVIVSGYLAFSVNYTKAFRMKNKIITIIEQYEGTSGTKGQKVNEEIRKYAKQIGYTPPADLSSSLDQEVTYACNQELGYCVKEMDATYNQGKSRKYYKVTTFINIDLPIINKILPHLKIFRVTGDTKLLYTS